MSGTTQKYSTIPIYSGNKKIIGRVKSDVFYKPIKGSKHILRRPPAIALDMIILDQAEQAGARFVQVNDSESGRRYRASICLIRERGFEFNRGFGPQIALMLTEWQQAGRGDRLAEQPEIAGVGNV